MRLLGFEFASDDRRRFSRYGLTLMELVIVMAVLAALASILIPLFPNLLRRAHKATDATQTSEITKAIQTYQASFVSYPDNFDTLVDATGAFPPYLPADGGTFGGFVEPSQLTANEAAALNRVGISNLQSLAGDRTPVGFHPTRNPYTTQTFTIPATGNVAAGLQVAVIDPASTSGSTVATSPLSVIKAIWAKDPTARFAVFGVGPRCSMIGQTIQDAPMSVPQKKNFTPQNTYSRVGVVFLISGVEVARTERARFVTSVALEDDELESTEKDTTGYYEVSQDPTDPN